MQKGGSLDRKKLGTPVKLDLSWSCGVWTKKIYIQELWFLRSAHRTMMVNIYMKFYEDILNSFQVTEWTRFCDGQTDGQTTMAKTISLPTLKGGDIIGLSESMALKMADE